MKISKHGKGVLCLSRKGLIDASFLLLNVCLVPQKNAMIKYDKVV